MFEDKKVAATWSAICEPGDMMAGYLRLALGFKDSLLAISSETSIEELLRMLPTDEFRAPDFESALHNSMESWRRRLRVINIESQLHRLHELGGRLLTKSDPGWPIALSDLGTGEPPCLWVLGDQEVLQSQQLVSVVGARIASGYGLEVTSDMTQYLVAHGRTIVSGGALGIDARAHQTAIESRGKTIAVMAGGLDSLYPSRNHELFENIKGTGLIISEVAIGVSPAKWRFLQRNRLIAALGAATLVVEAGYRSGSINTAGHANALERPVGAVPGPVNSTRSAGCHRLIREGRAELISTPSDLLELLGERVEVERQHYGLTDNQLRALDAVGFGKANLEEIAFSSGLSSNDAVLTLRSLENLGQIQRSSHIWQRTSNTL